MELKAGLSRMAGLFIYAAIIQGAIAASVTFLAAFGDQLHFWPVAASRVIASGEAGAWFTVGYLVYLIVGVVATAVTSLFYFYIETVLGKKYKGTARFLSWIHLICGNVGVAGASLLAMIGGYLGGAAMQPPSYGGMSYTTLQVHVNILQYYPTPIAVFLALGLVGFLAGGLGYLLAMRSKK